MKKLTALLLAALMLFSASMALADTVEPKNAGTAGFAGKELRAMVGYYDRETETFTVTVYDYDRYSEEDTKKLDVGDTVLAGGKLYQIISRETVGDTVMFLCNDGEEIYFEKSYDNDTDMIARSSTDDRIFMKVVAVLELPAAEGIVYEDNSDPDLEAVPTVTEGLEEILKIQAQKIADSIGFHYYSTTVTLNDALEIVKIHQDYDVAQ